ncbi:SDR family NAD(P)-dependent oxidoreductase, partial [Spirillospora sp. NPDC049652]
MSVWFITGASRGLGLEIAKAALAEGDRVVAAVRDPEAMPGLDGDHLTVRLDVTDERQARDAVGAALDRYGRIDVLVNNAGYGLFGAVEEISDAEARALFDTNVFGLLNVTRAVLPAFRAQRSGRVVNIGSIVGLAAGPATGVYGASKYAVEGITEALNAELGPLGGHATVVEPGSFRTGFLGSGSMRRAATSLPEYGETAGKVTRVLATRDGVQPGDPAKAAAAILAALD